MKTQTITKTYASKVQQFAAALKSASQDLLSAGKLLVEMIDENHDTFEILVGQKIASLPVLEALERVGRGQLDPLLLTDPSPAAHRAIAQCLPIKEQQTLQTGIIPVAVRDNGGIRIVNKRKDELTTCESYRVISNGRLLTADEQIEVLKYQEANRAKRELRYEIRGSVIHFYHDCDFTYAELTELLDKIKPSVKDIESTIKLNQIKR